MQMHRFQMGSAAMMPWLGVERLSAPFHAHTFPHCFSPFCRVLHSFFFYVGVLALRSMVLLSHSHRHGHCKLCRRLCTCRCPPKAGPAGPAGPCCLCHLWAQTHCGACVSFLGAGAWRMATPKGKESDAMLFNTKSNNECEPDWDTWILNMSNSIRPSNPIQHTGPNSFFFVYLISWYWWVLMLAFAWMCLFPTSHSWPTLTN